MKATSSVVGTYHDETYQHPHADGSYSAPDYDDYGYANAFVFTDLASGDFTVQCLASDPTDVLLALENGEAIGGIGVSSGTPAQDLEVAQAGVDGFHAKGA